MKSAMFEMLEMINNRSDNSLKTKFNEEEKNFWLEKEKQQIIDTYTAGAVREKFRAIDFAKWFADFNDLTWEEKRISKERIDNLYKQYLKTLGGGL